MTITDLHPFEPVDPVVTVRGLTKSYGGRTVVDRLDLEVQAGEVLGLIGANGAGKTTTVECLQGLRRPDAGEIRVLGLDPFHDADRLRPQIGSQLQSSGLPDRLRVAEAVTLFAGPQATDTGALLEQFGLAGKRRSPYAGLSGGERQRLFLVLALLNRARLVILDELTQGLDPAARREVWSAVAQLRDAGTTVLLVTHELDEAEALCERVVAMSDGQVLDQGTPAELVARHAREVVVRFALADALDGRGGRSGDRHETHGTADALQALNRLPGVAGVTRDRGQVAVRGDRTAIAHVGAWLVGTGRSIPADLRVDVPDLESALLTLLDSTPGRAA
ncbi:ABC transporter ATP-binding protein [Nocardioides immobilis]|uniref:ABC transporter ATP-binding protein n=1 Tax=Nocardioides immobilis TaxID=2049295 RepID=UPI0015FA6BF8|nr:ABC transporter ATP-binding protein [Nocardioides immobilis]